MSKDLPDLPPRELLELLADGEIHSGQELAARLGISRTAIWKQLAKLEALGLELISQSGKGYRLVGGLDLLDVTSIWAGLERGAAQKLTELSLFDVVDSTNAFLMRQTAIAGTSACLAEHQTAGRGRRGRYWVSPFASNICLSLRVSNSSGLGVYEGISLAIGVAVVRALKGLGVDGLKLKWPNDILYSGKKLGGILVEVVGDPSGVCHLVVGLGLNIKTSRSMVELIDQPWIALDSILAAPLKRNQVVISLLNQIVPLLGVYEDQGFGRYKQEWEDLNAQAGQAVDLLMGANRVSGIMQGVNESGALLLGTERGIEVFHGGEVSLRSSQ